MFEESSFSYAARSSAGASGIWQLMRGTSRSLLTINRSVDERLDPIASTRAASHILKENHQTLGNWPLAITAYNHGANGIRRARAKYGDDLSSIIENHRSRLFGFASKNFYAEFLAAVLVAKNRDHFFPGVVFDSALEFDQIRLSHRYRIKDLSEMLHLSTQIFAKSQPILDPVGLGIRDFAGRHRPQGSSRTGGAGQGGARQADSDSREFGGPSGIGWTAALPNTTRGYIG